MSPSVIRIIGILFLIGAAIATILNLHRIALLVASRRRTA
jgi:hypothetical protein